MAQPPIRDRVTALAAACQAAVLVDEFANHGSAPERPFAIAIDSLFALDAPDVAAVFGGDTSLATGREVLGRVVRRERGEDANRVNYLMAMLHLNAILRSDPDMERIIRTRLAQIAEGAPSGSRTTDDVIAKVAALYVDTFGSLRYRVQVKGDPRQLQVPDVAARIRASLFAGIRAAHLWHHLGGRRWQLLFGTGKMLEAL